MQSRVEQKVLVKLSKFVDYPPNYQPPCQIKAKEALSALNRWDFRNLKVWNYITGIKVLGQTFYNTITLSLYELVLKHVDTKSSHTKSVGEIVKICGLSVKLSAAMSD